MGKGLSDLVSFSAHRRGLQLVKMNLAPCYDKLVSPFLGRIPRGLIMMQANKLYSSLCLDRGLICGGINVRIPNLPVGHRSIIVNPTIAGRRTLSQHARMGKPVELAAHEMT
jgi:hypothetical protein